MAEQGRRKRGSGGARRRDLARVDAGRGTRYIAGLRGRRGPLLAKWRGAHALGVRRGAHVRAAWGGRRAMALAARWGRAEKGARTGSRWAGLAAGKEGRRGIGPREEKGAQVI